jgi:cephalosporin hydroxylase
VDIAFNRSGLSIHLADEVAAWADTFKSTMMDASELAHLAATLAAYPWHAEGIVVEIGAYHGSTSVFMAKVLQRLGHRVPVLSVDPFERAAPDRLNPRGLYAAYLRTVRDHDLEDVCLPLVAFSRDAAPVVPATIGVLVVDGGHHYPTVSQDLRLYAPKVLPGGLIFVDDYVDAYPGVMRAVDEYFVDARPFSIVHKSYFVVAQRRRGSA